MAVFHKMRNGVPQFISLAPRFQWLRSTQFGATRRATGVVLEGHPKIAQRFNVGCAAGKGTSPEGTAESTPSTVPSGLNPPWAPDPNVETLGYSQSSLRDGMPTGNCDLET